LLELSWLKKGRILSTLQLREEEEETVTILKMMKMKKEKKNEGYKFGTEIKVCTQDID